MLTIVMSTYNRDHLLRLTLPRLRKYTDAKVILIDDGVVGTGPELAAQYDCKYVLTENTAWRSPVTSHNLGAGMVTTPYMALMCAEIYLVNDCITPMLFNVKHFSCMAIPTGRHGGGANLNALQDGRPVPYKGSVLNTYLPFFMMFRTADYVGYSEEFAHGHGWDDDDFVLRMNIPYGLTYGRCIHLKHAKGHSVRKNLRSNTRVFKRQKYNGLYSKKSIENGAF